MGWFFERAVVVFLSVLLLGYGVVVFGTSAGYRC